MVFVKYDCSFFGTNRNFEFVLDSTMPLFSGYLCEPHRLQNREQKKSFLSKRIFRRFKRFSPKMCAPLLRMSIFFCTFAQNL